jgi:hypothetical protein
MMVATVATLAGIGYDFGQSSIMKTRLGSMESYAHYFKKDMADLLALSPSQNLERMKLLFSRTFSLLGFVCRRIRCLWTFYANFACSCTI